MKEGDMSDLASMFGPRSRMNRRSMLKGTAMLGGAALLAACSKNSPAPAGGGAGQPPIEPKIDGDLYYFNWAQYISPKLISGFEDHYGVTVHKTYFENEDEVVAKVGADQPYDIAVIGGYNLPKLIAAGKLREIDHAALQNYGEVMGFFNDPPYDPGAKHSVPYDVGPEGIAYRTDMVQNMTGSWNDLWTHPEAKGHTYVLDSMEDTIGMGLLKSGFPLDSGDPAQLDAAANALIELKPSLAGFSSNDYNMVHDQAWMMQAWTGDIYYYLSVADNPDLVRWQACKEGTLFSADNMVIPTAAKHPGTAMLFIDWMLHPENAATNVGYIGYPVPTTGGMAEYNKLIKNYPWLAVGDDQLNDPSQWMTSLTGNTLALWTQAWTKVKAA
jgi:spermidine/putrescine transport system substrate-binding protein